MAYIKNNIHLISRTWILACGVHFSKPGSLLGSPHHDVTFSHTPSGGG